jgi:putative membrane protein
MNTGNGKGITNLKLFFGLALIGLTVLFTLQNTAVIELRFMFWKMSMSRSLMVFFLVALGFSAGWLLSNWSSYRQRDKQPDSRERTDVPRQTGDS